MGNETKSMCYKVLSRAVHDLVSSVFTPNPLGVVLPICVNDLRYLV
jgi:hypothetical protein